MKDQTITLSKFLSRYLNLTGWCIKRMTHDEVKELFPSLERLPIDYTYKHPELVYTGEVVLVDDGINVIPYKAPKLSLDIEDFTKVNRKEEKPIKVTDKNIDYHELSIFELKLLLKRKFSTCKNRKGARKELLDRGVVLNKKFRYVRENKISEDRMEEHNAEY